MSPVTGSTAAEGRSLPARWSGGSLDWIELMETEAPKELPPLVEVCETCLLMLKFSYTIARLPFGRTTGRAPIVPAPAFDTVMRELHVCPRSSEYLRTMGWPDVVDRSHAT